MITSKNKIFIIAEISSNHGNSFNRAVSMVREAKKCGADAVKFQCYTPDTLTINCKKKYFKIKHPEWGGQTLYELYKKAFTPWEWLKKLKNIADNEGIVFFATAFDRTSVDFLEELNVPFHKISSFELVDLPLIEYAANTKKPLIMSTGMALFSEIKEAVYTAKKSGSKDITLLKCVSSYPAKPEEMNLLTLPDLAKKFRLSVGLSDHTLGTEIPIAAVALGAKIIEKHFTLSRRTKTPDCFFSIEPIELKKLVNNIRNVEKSLGKSHYGLTVSEQKSTVFRRSLFVVKDVKKGERFTEYNVRSIRPDTGLPPKYLKKVLSKRAARDIKRGEPMKFELLEGNK